jgi:excisionase family DNA binding protein
MRTNGSLAAATRTAPAEQAERSLLTVEEVAELLHVPPSWVYDHTRRRAINRIPGFRLGKYWRFRQADVLEWIECQSSGGLTR